MQTVCSKKSSPLPTPHWQPDSTLGSTWMKMLLWPWHTHRHLTLCNHIPPHGDLGTLDPTHPHANPNVHPHMHMSGTHKHSPPTTHRVMCTDMFSHPCAHTNAQARHTYAYSPCTGSHSSRTLAWTGQGLQLCTLTLLYTFCSQCTLGSFRHSPAPSYPPVVHLTTSRHWAKNNKSGAATPVSRTAVRFLVELLMALRVADRD